MMDAKNRQGLQYTRSLIEASLDPLFTISPDGKITDINNASINITESSRENLIGADFFEYFTEPQKAREIYKQVFAEGFVADYPLTIRDRKLTDVLFNGSVYKDEFGKVMGVVVVARDITDHKRIEQELINAKEYAEQATIKAKNATIIAEKATLTAENATLIAENATIIAEKAQAKAEKAAKIAEDAVKSKQQFLSNMSHEIRTPMNAIIGFTKVLLKTELTPRQIEYLMAIKTSGSALTVLINDILDLAKVDAGKMVFEKIPFKMDASISAMIHLFETKTQEKNLELIKNFDQRIPKTLVGDPVRLHQIILNLVSNAVKFTSKGNISVSAEQLSEDETSVIIEFAVTDTGIGIDSEKIEHIFENFQQATSDTSRLFGGTGLGLAIAKQLVESQGGSISVNSIPGVGSRFSFILTLQKTNEEAKVNSNIIEVDEAEIKNLKILVVEDIALNQLLMKTLLDEFGFEHDIAANGKIAIGKLLEKPYDLILMDLQMPEMNGFEATDYIRNVLNSKIPIIALTADVTTTDLKKCRAVGMNDYISKPVDEILLHNKIIDLFKNPFQLSQFDNTMKNSDIQEVTSKPKCHDLSYLKARTKTNLSLIIEMIEIYLVQTPPLLVQMKKNLTGKDWASLAAAVHKIIPSFSIMGIHKDFEIMAQNIQTFANKKQHLDEIRGLVLQVENVCYQACDELKDELIDLKKALDDK